jgi:uncharacterized membrane protein YedE/YeeE
MENFTPLESLLGGLLIGLAAATLLVTQGKIAGISGIVGGLLQPRAGDTSWRAWFLGGMFGSGALVAMVWPSAFGAPVTESLATVAVAGLLVGFGTRLANGCTSGHGVCGVARMSRRSMIATATFMTTGAVTVALVRVLGGMS